DGTSNSLMASEILVVPDSTAANDLRGRYNNNWTGNNMFTTYYPPNTTVADVQHYQGVSTSYAPATNSTATNNNMSVRGNHSGGVNTLFTDGHVAFVNNKINLQVWWNLATISGGEPSVSF